jgi:hypothetical protein
MEGDPVSNRPPAPAPAKERKNEGNRKLSLRYNRIIATGKSTEEW